MGKNKRVSPDGPGIIYAGIQEAVQGYIDEMAYGGFGPDTAVTFHRIDCQIPEENLLENDSCTCLPIRLRMGDVARVGAAHTAKIIEQAGYGTGASDSESVHEPDGEQ